MSRVKTFDATGIAPAGKLYAGDLNQIQDQYADLTNYGQNVGVGSLLIGEAGLALSRYGAGEARLAGLLRVSNSVYVDIATGNYAFRAVQPAASVLLLNKLLSGDANEAFQVRGDGKMLWGPGGAPGVDTSLYRVGAATLKTDGILEVGLDLILRSDSAARKLFFGSLADTNLYRVAAGRLRTDTDFEAFGAIKGAQSGSGLAFLVGDDAGIWDVSQADTLNIRGVQTPANGRITLGSAGDTNLYRSAADVLKTDDALVVGPYGLTPAATSIHSADEVRAQGVIRARFGQTGAVNLGNVGPGALGGLIIDADTNLYRNGVGILKTDGRFDVAAGIVLADSNYYGTSFPGSPVHGQHFILVDSTTNPTWQWKFRYNANNTTAYKWECIGGAPIAVNGTATGGVSTVGASYSDVTGAASITSPKSGIFIVRFGAEIVKRSGVTVSEDTWVGLSNAGNPPSDSSALHRGHIIGEPPHNESLGPVALTLNAITLTSGGVLKIQARSADNAGNTVTIARTFLEIVPVRCS